MMFQERPNHEPHGSDNGGDRGGHTEDPRDSDMHQGDPESGERGTAQASTS